MTDPDFYDPLERMIETTLEDLHEWGGSAPGVVAAVRGFLDGAIEGAVRREDAAVKDYNRATRKLEKVKAENRKLKDRLMMVAGSPVWQVGSTPVVVTNVETLPPVTPVSDCCVTMRGSVHHLHNFAFEYDEDIRDLVALREYLLTPRPWKEEGR